MRCSALCLLLVALTSTSNAKPPAWSIRLDGVGPLKVGMSITEVNRVLESNLKPPTELLHGDCYGIEPQVPGVTMLMFEYGKLKRIEIENPGLKTIRGIEVGQAKRRMHDVYGKLVKVEPDQYDPDSDQYLTIYSRDGRLAMRVLVHSGTIGAIHVGSRRQVEYVEGCL